MATKFIRLTEAADKTSELHLQSEAIVSIHRPTGQIQTFLRMMDGSTVYVSQTPNEILSGILNANF